MEVREIVKQWLTTNGHDGLCTDDCGCGVEDLMPCCTGCHNCVPAKKAIATEEDLSEWSSYEPGDDIFVPSNG